MMAMAAAGCCYRSPDKLQALSCKWFMASFHNTLFPRVFSTTIGDSPVSEAAQALGTVLLMLFSA